MWALRHPADAAVFPVFTGWSDARGIAIVCAAAGTVAALGILPLPLSAVVGVATVHGGLLAIALIWGGLTTTGASVVIALLLLARSLVTLHPLGGLAYLAVPLWLALLVRAGQLSRLGLGGPWPWGAVLIGAFAGSTLAVHLFACASRTLGYGVRFDAATFVPAFSYDLGANILSGELFFRGVVLTHLWRRCSFGLALTLASAAAAVRYCVDPFVATTELRLGAAVYMTLLAVLNGALYRWSGSLVPGLAAAAVFFACYRLLAAG